MVYEIICCLILYQIMPVHGTAIDVRLSPIPNVEVRPYEGLIEVLVNGTWGSIRRYGVDDVTAKTVCELLGYGWAKVPNVFQINKNLHMLNNGTASVLFNGHSDVVWKPSDVWSDNQRGRLDWIEPKFTGFLINQVSINRYPLLTRLTCVGNETTITECSQQPYRVNEGPSDWASGVHCFEQNFTELSLTGGQDPNSGQVLIKMDGRWGLLCGDNSISGTLRHPEIDLVICRTLGYKRALETVHAGVDLDIVISWLEIDFIQCTGNESHLNQCERRDGIVYQPGCYSRHVVSCSTELGEICSSDDICTAVANAVCIDDKCECRYGYNNNGTYTCSECDEDHYGKKCSQQCDCELNNVLFIMTNRSCDIITGSCRCKSNWTGSRCDIDSTIARISSESSDTQMLIIIISSTAAGFVLFVVIITACVCKYRKRNFNEPALERNEVSATGRINKKEPNLAMTSAGEEYTTIDDCNVGQDIDADTEYDLHPDLLVKSGGNDVNTEEEDKYDSDGYLKLERNDRNDMRTEEQVKHDSDGYLKPRPTDRTDAKTQEEDKYDSDGYLKPIHTNINTSYDYAGARTGNERLETDEEGYLRMEKGIRQLPDAPTVKQQELQHPYEVLKCHMQGEHVYSKMKQTK